MEESLKNIRIQRWVAIISVVLLALKLAAYFLTHSISILTDALESIANVVAGFIGLYSLVVSAKPRDADHPYGHGKIEFLSAALEGGMISVAAMLILYKSISNLIHPETIEKIDWGILLISITAVVNFTLGSICINAGKRNGSVALVASGKHLHSDTYTTLGILAGLALIYITGIQWFDSVVAISMSAFILFTGYKIIRTSIAGIMDESDQTLLTRMVDVLNRARSANWIDLHNLRVIKYGSTLHVDCHLTVPWYFKVSDAQKEVSMLEELVRKEFGDSLELFVHIDGCLDVSCSICSKEECSVRQHPLARKVDWTVSNISNNEKHDVNTPS